MNLKPDIMAGDAHAFPAWFRRLPIAKKEIEKSDAALLTERQGHVDKITRVRGEQRDAQPDLKKAVVAARVKRDKTREAAVMAQKELDVAVGDRHNVNSRADMAINAHEGALYASADARIGPAISEARKLWQATRSSRVVNSEQLGERNPFTEKTPVETSQSTAPSIVSRMAALNEIVEELEGMRYEAIPTSKIQLHIEALFAGVPDGTELVEV